MSHDATINAGEIARLVDVGRAAVSNWRRRYEDFPQPVGGTPSSPLFSLREVEDWLRRNGKSYQVSLADRVWQRLRASDADLRLGHLIGRAGAVLLRLQHGNPGVADRLPGGLGEPDDAELVRLLTDLADERGHAGAFEFLCERYQEAHSRQLSVTSADVTSLMVRLTCPDGGTVLDPACGTGTLLLATPATRTLGQDSDEAATTITAVRLLLREADAEIVTGDSLRQDGFPEQRADAVVCDPPFHERAWGHADLTNDPRWEYGLPPRGEPELAWLQHCLAHVKPGGMVAILMPTAAASRRPGKRIRGNLLRAGALRAVVTLPAGGPDLWLLRRPESGERPPSHLLMMEAGDDLAAVEAAWQRQMRSPEAESPETAVRIIDLLDDDVDLSPARHRLRRTGQDLGRGFVEALERFRATAPAVPDLEVLTQRRAVPATTIGELVKAGLITIRHGPAKMATGIGDVPVLTAEDVAEGRPPSGRTTSDPGLVAVEDGDVVASAIGVARVVTAGDAMLGPHLALYRVDRQRLDPDFLAGVLRCADSRARPGSSRIDARRTPVPRLPLAEQRAYGRAFRDLITLEDTVRQTAEQGQALVRLGVAGLIEGHLRPKS
jgi:hypothetical protein